MALNLIPCPKRIANVNKPPNLHFDSSFKTFLSSCTFFDQLFWQFALILIKVKMIGQASCIKYHKKAQD